MSPSDTTYGKINCLLYADDLVLISESEEGLKDVWIIFIFIVLKYQCGKVKNNYFNKSGKKICRFFYRRPSVRDNR